MSWELAVVCVTVTAAVFIRSVRLGSRSSNDKEKGGIGEVALVWVEGPDCAYPVSAEMAERKVRVFLKPMCRQLGHR